MARDDKWYCLEALESTEENWISAKLRVPETSLWFSGHFPGNPVLPGIAQLFLVLDVIEKATGKPLVLQKLHRTKYRRIIRPAEVIDLYAGPVDPDETVWRFELAVNDQTACRGRLQAEMRQ